MDYCEYLRAIQPVLAYIAGQYQGMQNDDSNDANPAAVVGVASAALGVAMLYFICSSIRHYSRRIEQSRRNQDDCGSGQKD